MKTSNKLLIAFAASLILLPLLGMVIVSRVFYEKGSHVTDFAVTIKSFDTPTKHLTNIATSAFQNVNITDNEDVVMNIHLIKDTKFGVKLSNNAKDRVQVTVDANGQLQVVPKKSEAVNGRLYVDLYIFSPNANALNLKALTEANIYVEQDSLHIDAKNIGAIYFHEQTAVNKLSINADATGLNFSGTKMASIRLDLSKTNVEINNGTFQKVVINSKGKATIDILGDRDNEMEHKIDDLVINTSDSAKVNIAAIQVLKCSGKFSDQTRVEMPAVNLNQMYLSKK